MEPTNSQESSPGLTVYTRSIPVSLVTSLSGTLVRVHAVLHEHIDLRIGDQVDSISVNEIIESSSGQTIIPSSLSISDFRHLISRIKSSIHEY